MLLTVAMTGCSDGREKVAEPSNSLAPTGGDICAHTSERGSYDGPLGWEHFGTVTFTRPWGAATRALDVGQLSLMTRETIVLDSVTLDPQNPRIFSPVRLLGAWVSRHAATYADEWAGHFPDRLYKLGCYQVTGQDEDNDVGTAPVLVIRVIASSPGQVKGRKWSANRGVVVHYHTLDGREYAAPYGLVNAYPNNARVNVDDAERYLPQPGG